MDWMYRGGKPDTEEFLLGKSVDKMVSEATTTTTEEGMDTYIYIYDLVPEGAHARGYALHLKIKHC